MTTITGYSDAMRPSATKPAAPTDAKSATRITSDFTTFLKMLTTQMQNQDPMNPIESSDYAVQLATFSGVEQQVQTNDLLKSLAASLGATGIGQLAGWVGMEARAKAPVAYDGTTGVTLSLTPKTGADKTVLIFTDANGKDVGSAEVAPMAGTLVWPAEVAPQGNWPAGVYGFRLESWSGEQRLGEDQVETYGKVIEAQSGKDGTVLVLEGGATVSADSVTAMRAPKG